MSEGPIKQWRDGAKVPRVSTPNNARTCALSATPGRAACGRRGTTISANPTCADCLASLRADSEARASSLLVEENGAQVLPPPSSPDQRRTVSAWFAHLAADADIRTKAPLYRELANTLVVMA